MLKPSNNTTSVIKEVSANKARLSFYISKKQLTNIEAFMNEHGISSRKRSMLINHWLGHFLKQENCADLAAEGFISSDNKKIPLSYSQNHKQKIQAITNEHRELSIGQLVRAAITYGLLQRMTIHD